MIRWSLRHIYPLLLLALLAVVLGGEGPPPSALSTGVDWIVSDVRFDFWEWEAGAVWAKFTHWLVHPQRYMRESDRAALVRDYEARVGQARQLRMQIETVYADPGVEDPDAATAEMRAEWVRLRAELAARQPVVEAIIEEQVGVVLVREGLGLLGQPFPPVGARFTPLPYFLIVSPRERIETIYQQQLQHGLDVARQEALEAEVDRSFNVSSLVTPIGGMSAWPAMMLESSDLAWVMEVAAHEWTHHYLDLHPLGWAYDRGQEARTINETTASIVGKEVGREVLVRYYPDLVPPPPPPTSPPQSQGPTEPPAFDFRAEMHKTRVEVDRLLAEGRVEEAEQYMEKRRRFFWEHGYRIRKLNQAYFAFYGSYADEPGAAGEDPIGPAVRRLREQSPTLRAFLTRIAHITTLDELRAALSEENALAPREKARYNPPDEPDRSLRSPGGMAGGGDFRPALRRIPAPP